jgi:signal transduction histidine kinase/ActR/RegA family two-component response regulator
MFSLLCLMVPNPKLFTTVVNVALVVAVGLLAYITSQTGASNSPAMVWMTILAIPALLLLGRRWAIFWLGFILFICLLQYLAVMRGWLSGAVNTTESTVFWVLLNKVVVMLSLMLAVDFYARLNQNQINEVEQRSHKLEQTQATLLQTQSHKDEFIASVGHELRTPMNAILGLNGVLLAELSADPARVRIAEHIRDSTQQLLHVVNDILDFSQLEASRLVLVPKPVQLEKCLRESLRHFETRAQLKGLSTTWQFQPGLPSWVLLDSHRMHQILGNLLDNAIKFTPQGGIRVVVGMQGTQLRLEVHDTGLGIPPDQQKNIFNRFEHADIQTNRAYGGTGLGLAICEKLVGLHGGRIGVHSTPLQGSQFWFELPLQTAQVPVELEASFSANLPNHRALHFLLVDDDTVNRMVGELVIQKSWPDATITTASSGKEALDLLNTLPVDVVLMDMVMPDMDGMETTRRLRTHPNPSVANLPVLGLTANNNSQDHLQCMQAGMNAVMTKPIDTGIIVDQVHSQLQIFTRSVR